MLLDNADAHPLEPFDGIVRRNGADNTVDVIVNLFEVDRRFRCDNPEPASTAHRVGRVGCRDHRL